MNHLAYTKDMERSEWLELRKRGLGGSDASVVCGINKYKSPIQLWLEKTGQIEAEEAGEAAYWGNVMEPIVKKEFTLRTGIKIKDIPFMMQHPKYDFMLANVDGMVIDKEHGKCIFEAKTASSYKQNDWVDSIPDEYMLQVQHYLAVTGCAAAYVAVLIGGNRFEYTFIKRDQELIAILIRLETAFWEHVRNNTPPEIDGSEACTKLMNRLYVKAETESKVELPEAAANLIYYYEEYQEKEKVATLEKDKAANQLKEMLGNHESGIIGKRVVLWKNVSSERFDVKRFKTEHSELAKEYLNTTEARRFSLK